MSDFMEMIVDMLPMHSKLHKEDNPLRVILDKTVGAWFDERENVYDELFLTTATGGWLDAWGKDYGVTRRLDEDDESFRERIIFEKLEYLTVNNLKSIYNLTLYVYVPLYNPLENQLTSDNPYISNRYMSIADKTVQDILNEKFIINNGIVWLEGDGKVVNSIIGVNGKELIYKYISILSATDLKEFFL